MSGKLLFKEHNFCIIDFYKIYKECEASLITDLYNYGLLNKKINKDAKTLITHHIILHVCNSILEYKGKEKNIIYFHKDLPAKVKLQEYFEKEKIQQLFVKIVHNLKTLLPIRVFEGGYPFKDINSVSSGTKEEIIAKIKALLNQCDYSNFTFSKIYTFTKRNNLTFLNKEYFNSIKSRHLLIA